ncbi:MAG: DUF5606 domain-containing protein [Muribaculaceae bacterium]|nr:DUF5606 domain-containing protein [Muribaculaceae bacterium]
MLKTVLSVSGKSGLFKLVSQGKNMLIVESLVTKKRTPAYASDKIVSLGDISIYTDDEDVSLASVLKTIYEEEGKPVDVKSFKDDKALRGYFETILPNYDQERVYTTDIKKLLTWYNILVEAGMTEFEEKQQEEKSEEK